MRELRNCDELPDWICDFIAAGKDYDAAVAWYKEKDNIINVVLSSGMSVFYTAHDDLMTTGEEGGGYVIKSKDKIAERLWDARWKLHPWPDGMYACGGRKDKDNHVIVCYFEPGSVPSDFPDEIDGIPVEVIEERKTY